jgi:hypothetical protein
VASWREGLVRTTCSAWHCDPHINLLGMAERRWNNRIHAIVDAGLIVTCIQSPDVDRVSSLAKSAIKSTNSTNFNDGHRGRGNRPTHSLQIPQDHYTFKRHQDNTWIASIGLVIKRLASRTQHMHPLYVNPKPLTLGKKKVHKFNVNRSSLKNMKAPS